MPTLLLSEKYKPKMENVIFIMLYVRLCQIKRDYLTGLSDFMNSNFIKVIIKIINSRRSTSIQYNSTIMSINDRMKIMSNKFKELKSTELPIVKKMIIQQLKKMGADIQMEMQLNECVQNTRRRRQIDDILVKCLQIQKGITDKASQDIGGGGRFRRMDSRSLSQAQLSKIAVRSIVMKEIRSSQLKIRPQQLEQIANKMQKNLEIMKQIQSMVIEQGNDLQKIDQYIEIAYDNSKQANNELDQAKIIKNKTRMMKFRAAIGGFFGVLGYKILGLPGMLFGMLFGATSV